jgi:hypothetical protein
VGQLDELRAETQRISEDDTDESDVDSSPGKESGISTTSDHHAFIFGYRSCDVDLRKLHPLPSQIPFMWEVFVENVSILIKIIHVPTTGKLVRQAQQDLDCLTPATEALMFSIYYAATTTLDEDEVCFEVLGPQDTLTDFLKGQEELCHGKIRPASQVSIRYRTGSRQS